ncbi:MAG: sigma 54-interacting transcriptional regulator [Planctomycetota bacterium]|jgi:two-component system response regulator HydG
MSSYLKVIRGTDLNAKLPLNRHVETLIGRGAECQVQLNDPMCSRVHAKILYSEGRWRVLDAGSRNGTTVNRSKTDTAVLADGDEIRVGGTSFRFVDEASLDEQTVEVLSHSADLKPNQLSESSSVNIVHGMTAFHALKEAGRNEDVADLHQLSISCISLSSPDDVATIATELLRKRTHATAVAFLVANEYGLLDVTHQYPDGPKAKKLELSDRLTELVCKHGKAVWMQQDSDKEKSSTVKDGVMRTFKDAICVPLLDDRRTIGAIHLYREKEVFPAHAFDFAIAASSILSATILRVQESQVLRINHDRLKTRNAEFDELIGKSPAMTELKEKIVRVARASGSILVRGESGSGKELVARAIHRASIRADRPMLSVNCAAIPSELMESQLFGHVKGAFTGADKEHVGWFEQANSSTLFLDEIGEMTLEGQAKLLRILEGHPFLPVGGRKEVKVDVRVIAATNRDLKEFVQEKRFREDLYYRLSVFELVVPPLRQRGEDIDLMIMHFFEHFSKFHGRPQLKLSQQALDKLRKYSWPGNVRQLRNVIDSAVVLANGEEIKASDLTLHETLSDADLDSLNIEQWEQRLIREALRRTRGGIPEASEMLGISRATMYRKLDAYNVDRSEFQ